MLSVAVVPAWGFAFISDGAPIHWAGCGTNTDVCALVVTHNTIPGHRPLNHLNTLKAAVGTWQARDVALDATGTPMGNITPKQATDVNIDGHDSQSVILHELGHAIGLGHPNLADRVLDENGLVELALIEPKDATIPWPRLTASTTGDNGRYHMKWPEDLGDKVPGSGDDVRDNDREIHYVDRDNNPLNLVGMGVAVDSTTFSPNKPVQRPQAPSREVASALFGLPGLEAVMVQGSNPAERQRQLSADDLNGIFYLEAGLDQLENTGDDYSFFLDYEADGIANVGGRIVGANIMLSGVPRNDFLAKTSPIFDRAGFYSFAAIYKERDVYTSEVIGRTDVWFTTEDCAGDLCIGAVDIFIRALDVPEPDTLPLIGLAALMLMGFGHRHWSSGGSAAQEAVRSRVPGADAVQEWHPCFGRECGVGAARKRRALE